MSKDNQGAIEGVNNPDWNPKDNTGHSPIEPEGLPDQKEGKISHIKELPEVGILDAEINSLVHGTRVYSPKVLQQYFWRAIDAIQKQFSLLYSPPEPSSKEQEGDAVEFAEWIGDKINPFIRLENGRWIQACGNSTSWSTEQLYKIYKSQNP